jgi:hypothetical protein
VATRSDEEVRGLISAVTMRLLRNAADSTQEDRLKKAIRDWYPDPDTVDEFELRRLTRMVQEGLGGMANLVEERLARLIDAGKAEQVPNRVSA